MLADTADVGPSRVNSNRIRSAVPILTSGRAPRTAVSLSGNQALEFNTPSKPHGSTVGKDTPQGDTLAYEQPRCQDVSFWLRLSKKSGTTKIKQHSIRLSSSTDIMIQNDPKFRNIVSISFDLRSSSTASAKSGHWRDAETVREDPIRAAAFGSLRFRLLAWRSDLF